MCTHTQTNEKLSPSREEGAKHSVCVCVETVCVEAVCV